jgi:GPI mannosyltransferase 3
MRRTLAALIAVVAAVQIWMAYRYFGFMTGDDVEVLSEAFRRARGVRYTPWDIRNLFVPDVVVAPMVWLTRGLTTRSTIFVASLPFVAISAVTVFLVYRLALRWSSNQLAALVAALLFATHWIPLGFGSTVYPRTLAAACVVGAALIVERSPFAAGMLIGVAFADRFSEIVFLAPLLLVITKHRQECLCHIGPVQECLCRKPRPNVAQTLLSVLRVVLGAALSILLTIGIYDWLTWGTPFSSIINFAHLTIVAPDFASRVKYQAPWWYLANLARCCSPALLPLLWYARRSRALWFIVIPLVTFSAIQHKELRYLQVMIPFLCIAAAIGFASMRNRRIAVALVAVSMLWNLYGLRSFARKSQPAVMAAQWMASNPSIHSIAASQLWAFGDKLYLGDRMAMSDLGTPPEHLNTVRADAVAMYDTDLDVPSRVEALRANGYAPVRTFRDGPARGVVVFMKRQ